MYPYVICTFANSLIYTKA